MTSFRWPHCMSSASIYPLSEAEMRRDPDPYELQFPPHNSFWETFPKRGIPASAQTPVDIDVFEGLIEQVKPKFTVHQILRAKKCISFLRSRAPAFQIKELPPIFCENVPSTAKRGQLVTDTIAVWIKKGFASGPF